MSDVGWGRGWEERVEDREDGEGVTERDRREKG